MEDSKMKRTKRRSLTLVLRLALLFGVAVGALVGCGPQEPEELVFGAIYPLTGALAIPGNAALGGVKVAVEMVNEEGGVLGKQVVLEVADGPDPSASASQAERLINEKKVPVIFGTYGSSNALAATAVTERNKVVWVDGGTMSIDLTTRGHRYTFRTTPHTDLVGADAAQYMVDLVAPAIGMSPQEMKIAVIHEDSAFGTSIGDAFSEAADALGLNVVLQQPYDRTLTDLSPLVLSLKAAEPDVIMATQYINDEILFFKQAQEMGLNFKGFVGSGGMVGIGDFHDAVGDATEGVMEVDGASADIRSRLPEEQQALAEEFVRRYKEQTGYDQPTSAAMNGFLAASTFLTRVLPEAGEVDPDKIREAYLSLDVPEGGTCLGYGLKYGEDGQNQRIFMIVRQWQGDKFVVVAPEKWETDDMCCLPLEPWEER
jgi:branched-chain amino acid transport system substrate-binding protein